MASSIKKPRRSFLVEAKFKSGAGVHKKSNKALRKAQNQEKLV